MPFWSRWLPNKPVVATADEESILVISDIHLGEDILDEGPDSLSEYIRALNRELAHFVAAHRQEAEDGRRWHLVINGDMFDFLKITDRRDTLQGGRDPTHGRLTPVERARDLVNTPSNVVWKLERVLEVHRPLFKELAAFLLDGHKITIVEGNHDAEFYFDEVRDTLRQALVRLAERVHKQDKRKGVFDAELVANGLAFRTWFEASAGRYHIEHGHQYDPYCSFEYNLAPFDNQEVGTLATPLTHRAVPYVADLLGDFSTHGIESWTFREYIGFFAKRGLRTLWTLMLLYFTVGWELLRHTGRKRQEQLQTWRVQHQQHLRELAERTPYGVGTLQDLDAQKALPVEYSPLRVARAFYFDRVVIGLAGLVGALVGALADGRLAWGVWLGTFLVVAVGVMLSARGRRHDIAALLRKAAARIADVTGTRYVVFGHSHHPELVDLTVSFAVGRFGERAYYINSGSWVTREILLGEAGSGMSYVAITKAGAALLRWVGPNQPPVILAQTGDGEAKADNSPASSAGGAV